MPLETRVFDPARYLVSDEARAAYLTEALETGGPTFIADALAVTARARGFNRAAGEGGVSSDGLDQAVSHDAHAQLGRLVRIIRALELCLTVRPAAS
jgi:probable addiction module antidote protein